MEFGLSVLRATGKPGANRGLIVRPGTGAGSMLGQRCRQEPTLPFKTLDGFLGLGLRAATMLDLLHPRRGVPGALRGEMGNRPFQAMSQSSYFYQVALL